MIDLMNLPAAEAERIAYAEGFTGTSDLFARIAALEHAATVLLTQLDLYGGDYLDDHLGDEIAEAAYELWKVTA